MATIALYKDKLNGVGGLIDNIIKSSNNLDTQLGTLKSTLQGVSNSTYNLQDTVNSISSSSKTEKEKVNDLKKLNKQVTEFITTTVKRDNSARDEINKSKKDFYAKYNYLKPDCEKNAIEKIVDKVEKAAEWCAKHWKLIATAVIVVVAVALIATGVGAAIGGTLLVGACWGAITGAVIGGVAGGINSIKNGGSFFEGFENGSFDGAVGGMIGGAISGAFAAGLAFKPGLSLASSILKNAGVGALSSGVSNSAVTTLNYLIDHRNFNGAMDDVLTAALSGAITGGIIGGVSGAFSFTKFTTQEKASLTRYTGNEYRNINNSLRGLEAATPENQTAINNIQAAMNKSQMPKNMILYRGSDIAELGDIGNLSTQDMVGKSFTELAFTSTSTSNQVASGTFSGNLQMRIFAKRGTHALDLSVLSHYSGEKEILFGAGQQFKITNANMQNGVLYIDVIAK